MYFDDTTTVLDITQNSFDEDRTLILNGEERLKYFAEHYYSEPMLSPLNGKKASFLNKLKMMIKR